MILVTGAAGKTGKAVLRALQRKGIEVRALVHHSEQIAMAHESGAQEAIAGDIQDQACVQKVLHGITAVYHICSNVNLHEITIGRMMINSSKAAGVKHFVYHSVMHPHIEKMPHHWQKLRVEEMLFESGLDFTILQPCAYMQNILSSWEQITQKGIYAVPYPPQTRISIVDLEDVSEAAAIVLTQPVHTNATYELAGPQPLSQGEVAIIISQQLQRTVKAEEIPLETWKQKSLEAKMKHYSIETLYKMFDYYAHYGFTGNSQILEWLLGRKATTFEEFITKSMKR